MHKVTILFPTKYNDGKSIPLDTIDVCLQQILAVEGGYTSHRVHGAYTMANGSVAYDELLSIIAFVPFTSQVDTLRNQARVFAKLLRQECIYFEVSEVEVQFVN
jgi:hypothetical protein